MVVVQRHSGFVNCVTFSPDGLLLASASTDHTVRLQRLDGRGSYTLHHASPVQSVAFSPDGQVVASGAGDGKVRLWRVSDQSLMDTLDAHQTVYSVAFSPDGTTLLSGGEHSSIWLWRVDDLMPLESITRLIQQEYQKRPSTVDAVQFSPSGNIIASAGNGVLYLWRSDDGSISHTLPIMYAVNSLCFSPDGSLLALAEAEGPAQVWRVAEGLFLDVLQYAGAYTEDTEPTAISVAFSPNGSMLASGGTGGVLQTWRAADRASRQVFAGHSDDVWSVAFSPDGTALASGSLDGTVRLWPVKSS